MNKLPTNVQEAKLLNSKYYFNGKQCPNGHICERYTASTNCVQCDKNRSKLYRSKHQEHYIKYNREWYQKNKDYVYKYNKKYMNNLKNRCRASLFNTKYNNVPCNASIDDLINNFTGKCYICDVLETECNKKLCMDHCHETGIFRGWICDNCNVGLSRFKDNIDILKKAIDYLEAHCNLNQSNIED